MLIAIDATYALTYCRLPVKYNAVETISCHRLNISLSFITPLLSSCVCLLFVTVFLFLSYHTSSLSSIQFLIQGTNMQKNLLSCCMQETVLGGLCELVLWLPNWEHSIGSTRMSARPSNKTFCCCLCLYCQVVCLKWWL